MVDTQRFLRELRTSRETTLEAAAAYFPERFKDHRDMYWLSSLIKNGFVDIWLESNKGPWKNMNEKELAISLYMSVLGPDNEYLGIKVSGADFKSEKVFCTAMTDLYFEELKDKQIERWFAAFLAIVAALLSAWATAYFSK
jgi:hypothetical protein